MKRSTYSVKIDLAMWLIPLGIVTALGVLSWKGTHRLDPYKPIDSSVKPLSIEVVSLDWKWLFIYRDWVDTVGGPPPTAGTLFCRRGRRADTS